MIRLGTDIRILESERCEIYAELHQTAGSMTLQHLERLMRRLNRINLTIKSLQQ